MFFCTCSLCHLDEKEAFVLFFENKYHGNEQKSLSYMYTHIHTYIYEYIYTYTHTSLTVLHTLAFDCHFL